MVALLSYRTVLAALASFGAFLTVIGASLTLLARSLPYSGAPTSCMHTSSDNDNDNHHYLVDLGYQQNLGHAVVNNTLVTFRNIRFAAPPLGSLRFRAPTPPPVNRTEVQNATDVICPQGYAKWFTEGAVVPFLPSDIPPVDPRTSEDCLFLDVLLPRGVWERRQSESSRVPVLVWIHGGGFAAGWKDGSGQGHGLVTRGQQLGSRGVILVSINYRLGLFGWMNGAGVTQNAGLLDQRLALEWVQQNIHLFGGDPYRVTIIGESAGGSSVEAHITAFGGTKAKAKSLFKGAIAQSPYSLPTYPSPNSRVDGVLHFGNVSSIEALRGMSSADLQKLNALIIGNSRPYGTSTFGIVPDGNYVPGFPGKLLHEGRFNHELFVMTGHNQDEGSLYISSKLVPDSTSYRAFLSSLITPNESALNSITQVLYPPIFDSSQGYTSQTERNNLTIADAVIICNTRSLNQAPFHPPTYAYEWFIPPATHGADLQYTFYDFEPAPEINTTVARILQGYILQFAETGNPGDPVFPPARPGLTVQHVGSDYVGPASDERGIEKLPERCRFWQDVPYLREWQ